jgi:hypothetical protein
MKRLKRLETYGYQITRDMSSNKVMATKGQRKYTAKSITALYNLIFN